MKTCSTCRIEKPLAAFSKSSQKYCGGLRRNCKECEATNNSVRANRLRTAPLRQICADCDRDKPISEFNKDKHKASGFRTRCRDCDRAYKKVYYKANIPKANLYALTRRRSDPQYKLRHTLRTRINKFVSRDQKAGSAVRDLGCTVEFLKGYLEVKFRPEMSWANHGDWHVDHIIPLIRFDLTNREEFLKACHYTNLQPMWAVDNMSKGAK